MRIFDIPEEEIIDKFNKIHGDGLDSIDDSVTKIHKHYESYFHIDLTYLLRYHITHIINEYNTNKNKK